MWRSVRTALFTVLAATLPAAGQTALPVTTDHYRLEVDLDYQAARLSGLAELDLRNVSDHTISEVPLQLYRLMTVEGVRDPEGALRFEEAVRIDPDVTTSQSNVVTVQLRRPLSPQAAVRIAVRYGGHLLGRSETGMLYIKDRIDPAFTLLRNDGQAFPLVGTGSLMALRSTPAPSFDYHAEITVPDTLAVVSGAPLASTRVEDHRATYVFESAAPSWRMDFAIGDYRTLNQGPIRIHYLAQDSAGAARIARAARNGMSLFTDLLGPLPGHVSLGIIEFEDGYGSQTDVGAIMQAAAAFRDSTRANELYHEISHLWNVVETDQPPVRWQEGLASFLEWYALKQIEGEDMLDRIGGWFFTRTKSTIAQTPSLGEVPMVRWGEARLSQNSYAVGGLFFQVLYRVAGEEATMRFLRAYVHEYRDGVTAREFARFAEETLGPSAARLFDDWWMTTRWTSQVQGAEDLPSLVRLYQSAAAQPGSSQR